MSVTEGEPLNLRILYTGNPIPDVTWTKDGKVLQPSDRIIVGCDDKKINLEINPSDFKDSGQYACEVKNPLGSDKTSAEVTIRRINQSPAFVQKFSDLQQMADCDAKFIARVTGIPTPEVTWYFNDRLISSDNPKYKIKRDGETCALHVLDCTNADSGHYRCRAVNKEGKDECDAALAVVKQMYVDIVLTNVFLQM